MGTLLPITKIMKVYNQRIVNRWNKVIVGTVGIDYMEICDRDCEINQLNTDFDIITKEWLIKETEYWLSCYYEEGHCFYDLKEDWYENWYSATKKLKRLIATIKEVPETIIVDFTQN